MLITNTIKEKTSIIKTFAKNEAASKKSAEQKKIDATYREAICGVNLLTSEVVNTCANSKFQISESVHDQFIELLTLCSVSSDKSKIAVIDVNGITSKEKEIRSSLQYEWNNYHAEETASIEEVLNVVKGIANVNVNSLLLRMNAAKNWNKDVTAVIDMMNAIREANEQINKMRLTDTTVAFLRKVIAKSATLEDITDDVMQWLKEEGIQGKVKISF